MLANDPIVPVVQGGMQWYEHKLFQSWQAQLTHYQGSDTLSSPVPSAMPADWG